MERDGARMVPGSGPAPTIPDMLAGAASAPAG
jgi:hypothetical protein